jgi:hypothetical protein
VCLAGGHAYAALLIVILHASIYSAVPLLSGVSCCLFILSTISRENHSRSKATIATDCRL